MRGITITYKYSGDEDNWQTAVSDFIAAIDNDPEVVGKFTYQVAVADDKETRFHWGRWDSAETLAHVQLQEYFKTFAGKVREFANGAPSAIGHDILHKTSDW
jgi:quinol monooxygenase YgiN